MGRMGMGHSERGNQEMRFGPGQQREFRGRGFPLRGRGIRMEPMNQGRRGGREGPRFAEGRGEQTE